MYGKIKEHDSEHQVEVYDNDILLFAGFIYELGEEFYRDGHVKCKGEMDYLNESIVRPYATYTRGYGTTAPDDLPGYFEWLISQHNNQVDESKQFVVGINQAAKFYGGQNLTINQDEYPTTISEISDIFLGDIGGILRIRHEIDIRYIDLLYEYSDVNTQILDFGVNLTDYSKVDVSESLITGVIPTGARLCDTECYYTDGYFQTSDTTYKQNKTYYTRTNVYWERANLTAFETGVTYYQKSVDAETGEETYYVTSHTTPQSGVTYYVLGMPRYSEVSNITAFESGVTYYEYDGNNDESQNRLTIASLADISYDNDDFIKSGDLLYTVAGRKKYGHIYYNYHNSEMKTAEDLLNAAIVDFKENISPKRTIEIKAVDMHLVNPSIKPIRIGEFVRVRSNPHKFDSYLLCRNIALDLNDPDQSIYTLGTTYDTLTGEANKKINELNNAVNRQIEIAKALSNDEKERANTEHIASLTRIASEQDAAICLLYEMILSEGGM